MVELEVKVDELVQNLIDYSEEVQKELKSSQYKVAHRVKKLIMAAAPERTGKYKKSWGVRKKGKAIIIHAGDSASLTHLLEKGHKTMLGRAKSSGKYVNRAGKRAFTRGFPHIKPAEAMVDELMDAELERIFGK